MVKVSVLYPKTADSRFGPADAIVGDIPNYTNTQPTIQVSDVKL